MTAFVVIEITNRLKLNLDQLEIEIFPQACALIGTSANLCERDILTARQLLYGMMLPSGNDAALTLGIYYGCLLYTMKLEN